MLEFEDKAHEKGFDIIIGIDEAGRGPLAGPVVAAAVILKNFEFKSTISDSKKLSPQKRAVALEEIRAHAYVGIAQSSQELIDRINILQATFMAMNKAVEEVLTKLPDPVDPKRVCLLVDGNRFKTHLPYTYWPIVSGDAKSLSIASASIVAKQTRDRIVDQYDEKYPEYGFKKHKGYPTKQHKEAIAQYGLLDVHRKTFRYV